jgi:predicted anti-sigma-YlaC factor YlaD
MDCHDVDELLPGIALGTATPEERREVEEHLAACRRHPQLAGFEEIAEMLPMSLPSSTPREHVKHRLMARVYTDLEPVVLRRSWWQHTWSWAVAAVLAVLAIGLGVRDWAVSSQLAGAPVTWGLAPTGATAPATGTLVYLPRQNTTTLTLQQLPQLPADRVYEVWLIRGGTPEPAGVFKPAGDGSASVIVKGVPSGFDQVAVTEEPGPEGSAAPTSQPFLTGSLK